MNAINIELVTRNHLFSPMNAEQLRQIIATTKVINLREGEALFTQDQQADYFFLVISGRIKLFRVSADGNEKIIELPSGGRLFAEAVMFMEQRRYPVNATALQDSTLYSFNSKIYRELLHESSTLCFALFADISQRLHGLLTEIDQLTLQNATYRVVGYLTDLIPESHTDSVIVDLAAPKQTIAARLSITPETFSRILRSMADAGIISIHGKTIGVHDSQRLRAFGHNDHALYGTPQK